MGDLDCGRDGGFEGGSVITYYILHITYYILHITYYILFVYSMESKAAKKSKSKDHGESKKKKKQKEKK